MKKRSPAPLTSLCDVCGSPAPKHVHFGGQCCYPCRAFFRRTVLNYEDASLLLCRSGTRECPIDAKMKECMFCRFQKCLAIGMNPSLMQGKRKFLSSGLEQFGGMKSKVLQADFSSRASYKHVKTFHEDCSDKFASSSTDNRIDTTDDPCKFDEPAWKTQSQGFVGETDLATVPTEVPEIPARDSVIRRNPRQCPGADEELPANNHSNGIEPFHFKRTTFVHSTKPEACHQQAFGGPNIVSNTKLRYQVSTPELEHGGGINQPVIETSLPNRNFSSVEDGGWTWKSLSDQDVQTFTTPGSSVTLYEGFPRLSENEIFQQGFHSAIFERQPSYGLKEEDQIKLYASNEESSADEIPYQPEMRFTVEEESFMQELKYNHDSALCSVMRTETNKAIVDAMLGLSSRMEFFNLLARGKDRQTSNFLHLIQQIPQYTGLSAFSKTMLLSENMSVCWELRNAVFFWGHSADSLLKQEEMTGISINMKDFLLKNKPNAVNLPSMKYDFFYSLPGVESTSIQNEHKTLARTIGETFKGLDVKLFPLIFYIVFFNINEDLATKYNVGSKDQQIIKQLQRRLCLTYSRFLKHVVGVETGDLLQHQLRLIFAFKDCVALFKEEKLMQAKYLAALRK